MPLPVAEIFGPTLQGEGPYAGRVADFVRFGGCNLACSWCDTAYTWDSTRYTLREEITDKSADQIMDELSGRSSVVVFTGGEPMLYATRPDFHNLLQQLRAQGRAVHVETNGTLVPPDESRGLIAVYVVSPKLSNAGTHRGRQDPTFHPSWVEIATQQEVHLKYVCESAKDVETAVVHASTNGWRDRERIWVMPQASNTAELAMRWPEIATEAAKVGVNATSRLHLLAWGTERRH